MITKYTYEDKAFHFIEPKNVDYNRNIFTILVGKNGTGKSRLLSAIVKQFIDKPDSKHFHKNLESGYDNYDSGTISYAYTPPKIIAVSTSPFDRFPLVLSRKEIKNYSYLGIRELMTHNFGLAYVSKIISSLIEVTLKDPNQIREITTVLKYLGYTDKIKIKIQSKIGNKFQNNLLSTKNPVINFEEIVHESMPTFAGFTKGFFFNEDQTISKNKVAQLVKILKNRQASKASSIERFYIEIDRNGIDFHLRSFPDPDDLIFLLKSGFARLQDVSFEKRNTYETYSISEASSGEQSVVISILGIASQIQDHSLICIDEPEICLHPEWQERYIKILTTTFNRYRGCHFIIATHSPQVVSNLNSKNSYILSMETGKILNAKEVVNHSADFQLAKVFNSPGFQNEFLSRIALNIFTKVSKRKSFDEIDIENYEILKSKSEYLEDSDPVLDLYKAITKMYKIYG